MRRLDSLRLWCAAAFLVAVAAAALAGEPRRPDDRGAPTTNMATQSKIVSDALASAEWISTALSQSGYRADFTLESRKQIDRIRRRAGSEQTAQAEGLLSEQLGARLFAIDAYVGEVIRRQNSGEWQGDDNDTQAEINIAVRLKMGTVLWPVQRVIKRFKNGAEDGIWIYGATASAH
jgi:hypothetical protein